MTNEILDVTKNYFQCGDCGEPHMKGAEFSGKCNVCKGELAAISEQEYDEIKAANSDEKQKEIYYWMCPKCGHKKVLDGMDMFNGVESKCPEECGGEWELVEKDVFFGTAPRKQEKYKYFHCKNCDMQFKAADPENKHCFSCRSDQIIEIDEADYDHEVIHPEEKESSQIQDSLEIKPTQGNTLITMSKKEHEVIHPEEKESSQIQDSLEIKDAQGDTVVKTNMHEYEQAVKKVCDVLKESDQREAYNYYIEDYVRKKMPHLSEHEKKKFIHTWNEVLMVQSDEEKAKHNHKVVKDELQKVRNKVLRGIASTKFNQARYGTTIVELRDHENKLYRAIRYNGKITIYGEKSTIDIFPENDMVGYE